MRRRSVVTLVVGGLLAALLALSTGGVDATPAGFDDSTYEAYGRVFPDPHGCVAGAPQKSPWAKGNICAVQFVQWNEALDGLKYLESRFPRYLQVINLRTQFGDLSELDGEELQSAGLPREDLTRDRRDLHVIKVTDRESTIPEADRRHFAYSLSIHGVERAGLEGGIRAIEDLVTWAACEDDATAAPACAEDGPFPKPILEPTNSGPTAGQVVRNGVVYFILSNPDGWHRGEWSEGSVFFQRYNGNGMDLNRDWPAVGYTEAQYTPGSEPETRGHSKFLKYVANRTSQKRFAGGIDLHGMLQARSFSFTLLGAGERDYRKNAVTVDTAITTFRDSETRLSWSPLIATAEECPGDIEIPENVQGGGNLPMCSDQWGTVWDTIDYQVTGSFGDWMDSPMGLNGVGINNEMAFSHVAPNNVYHPDIEQLHIDGNKGLVYAQISSLLFEKPVQYKPNGRIAYVHDPRRVEGRGGGKAVNPIEGLPTQDDLHATEITGAQGFEFEVKGPSDGFYNGGLTIEATFTNARAISGGSGAGVVSIPLVLERFGSEHPGDPEDWHEVARYFNQSPLYEQAGARIDLNDPKPGRYRIAPNEARLGPTSYQISFSAGKAVEVPEQARFDASRMDFFTDLNEYTPEGSKLTRLRVEEIVNDPAVLDDFDSLVVSGDFLPRQRRYSVADRERYIATLAAFARGGGNLVLTDGAIEGLATLGAVDASAIGTGVFFAGWMDFADGAGPTYDRHPLARAVNKEGTAEGSATLGDERFENRHQTYEPVPLGYYVSPSGANNADCTGDLCDSPNWIVDEAAWKAAGGTVAARTLVKESADPDDGRTKTGVSLGGLNFGKGRIRIAGALLPNPTTQNYHPFGLESYSLTYTGYQVFENLVRYKRPA